MERYVIAYAIMNNMENMKKNAIPTIFHLFHLFFNCNKVIDEHINSHQDSLSKKHLHIVEVMHCL